MGSSLLRDWGLLQDCVIPPLQEAGADARLWAIGDPADAVAITVAMAEAEGKAPTALRSFTPQLPADASTVSFGTADVRCLPPESRAAWFDRRAHRWVPKMEIAEQVTFGPPTDQVDLIALRSAVAVDGSLLDCLRAGGHLFIADPGHESSAAPSRGGSAVAEMPSGLAPIGAGGRLFRKEGRGSGEGRRRPSAGSSSDDGPGGSSDGLIGKEDRHHRCHEIGGGLGGDQVEGLSTLADRQRQEDLVLSHLELAKALARRFANRGQPLDDLEQVTRLGLVRAARRFDPARGNAFASYATANILGELKRYFRDKTWSMRVPRPLQELHLAAKDARDELGQILGAVPTVAQVATHLGVSEEELLEAMEAGSTYRADPLDSVGPDLRSRDIPVTDSGLEQVLDRERLRAALPRLDETERIILKGLYFEGRTQQDLAGQLGVSQMQISRLHARAGAKLRR